MQIAFERDAAASRVFVLFPIISNWKLFVEKASRKLCVDRQNEVSGQLCAFCKF